MSTERSDELKRYVAATQRLERAKRELNSAECELTNATNALGKHLAPRDAKEGESFSIWLNGECVGMLGDVLLTANYVGNQSYKVSFRK